MKNKFEQSNEIKIKVLPFNDCIAKICPNNSANSISVYDHCIFAGYVATELLDRMPQQLRELFPEDTPFWVACHDVGKVSPGFQRKINNNYNVSVSGLEEKHALISETSLRAFLTKNSNYTTYTNKLKVLGMHHGSYATNSLNANSEIFGGIKWQIEREKLISQLKTVFKENFNLTDLNYNQMMALAGLLSVSDWIASNEKFFSPCKEDLSFEQIKRKAQKALDEISWFYPKLEDLDFKSIFGFKPNDLQSKIINLPKQKGIYIIEAPMGMGKTEAALYLAYELIKQQINNGIYFALPTRFTSNKIHERVDLFIKKISVSDFTVRLIHSSSFLSESGEELRLNGSWFLPSKRALLMPFGVGTVDQTLYSVLPVYHNFIRVFGLTNKVVIIDELHSYDLFTSTLINKMVEQITALNGTVIILSATLTQSQTTQLLGNVIDSKYPLISFSESSLKTVKHYNVKAPEDKKVCINFSHNLEEITSEIIKKYKEGNNILWIANTIKDAQKYYQLLQPNVDKNDIGLIHSRFPAFKRDELEKEWFDKLGKNATNRPSGSILVSTQIMEQSVDIDADILVTDLAPTDMILQRIGRIWRHKGTKRKIANPMVFIFSEDLSKAQNIDTFKDLLAGSGKVYFPLSLYTSFHLWKNKKSINIPSEIKDILTQTYNYSDQTNIFENLKEEMENEKNKLQKSAHTITNDNVPIQNNDENIKTRWSQVPTIKLLIIKQYEKQELLLLSDDRITLTCKPDITTIRKIYKNILPIPEYFIKNNDSSFEFENQSKFFTTKEKVYSVITTNDHLFDLSNNQIDLSYSDQLGVF